MALRLTNLASAVCIAGAVVFAALAIMVFSGFVAVGAAWVMVATAVILMVAGFKIQTHDQELAAKLHERHSHAELLAAQLHEQSRAIDALADGLDVAVFICDPRGNVSYANRRACDLFRFESPVGKAILAITLSYDLEQLVIRAVATGDPQTQEVVFTYPDERVGLAKAWPAESGARAFLSVYEITDLRRLERVRQDFVANVSHELRTPMTVIRAYAETLLDEADAKDELAQRYLPRIVSEIDRLSTISQDLLILSAAESNPVRKQVCDIAEVFRNVVGQLSIKANEKGIGLTFEGPDRLPIEANVAQMTQVALNLVDNAINYTPNGFVKIVVGETSESAVVTVSDSGIGIAAEHIGRIFERFYRVDKGRSRLTGGTGLGLSIIRHIVEAHGGTVTVDSALNVGSTFTVTLPKGSLSL